MKWQSKILEDINISPKEQNMTRGFSDQENTFNGTFNPNVIPIYPYGMMGKQVFNGGVPGAFPGIPCPFNMVPYLPVQGGFPMMGEQAEFNNYAQLMEENKSLREELNEKLVVTKSKKQLEEALRKKDIEIESLHKEVEVLYIDNYRSLIRSVLIRKRTVIS
jgi:hypothetical protein